MSSMDDVCIRLADRPGALAAMGRALELKGISIEGGGAWICNGNGAAHFLFAAGKTARAALEEAGIEVVGVRETVTVRLAQDVPGQLGKLCGAMAEADVNIEALYSDHGGNLILVVDRPGAAREVARSWKEGRAR